LDLTQDLDGILKQMHKTTRYNVRYAARKGVAVRVGGKEDLTILDQLMQVTGRRAGFTPRKLDYYERQWEVFAPLEQIQLSVATYEGRALAASVDAMLGECAANLHIASSNEHKNLKPNHRLTWEAIKWAKSRNCRTFDLWGIPEEVGLAAYEGKGLPVSDRTGGLWGVYRFKRGFCKNVVLYASAHDYVYSPSLYPLVTSRFLNTNVLDRIAVWMDGLRTT
jgi:lipid II:glycine glycyltransferase (peptidoglycan interpeptide bridge formation enzyme)